MPIVYTNSTGLPGPVYRVVAHNPYEKEGDFSVSELCSPPRKAHLMDTNTITVDVKDLADSIIGNAVHSYYEGAAEEYEIVEHRLFADVDGYTISGQIDYFHPGLGWLCDWKTPSTAEWHHIKQEREDQLNVYAYLLGRNGYDVKRLTSVFTFKGYSPMKAQYGSMPPASIAQRDVEIWPTERTEAFIRERLEMHVGRNDDTLCTDEERWIRPKYAVMKPGAKRATRVFDTEEEAADFATEEHEIEFRAGEPVRCQFYCEASNVCEQFQGEGL